VHSGKKELYLDAMLQSIFISDEEGFPRFPPLKLFLMFLIIKYKMSIPINTTKLYLHTKKNY
jgi:hypothetical protein